MSHKVSPVALLKKYGLFSLRLQNFLQPCCSKSGGKSVSNCGPSTGGGPPGVWGTGCGPGVPGVPGVPGATGMPPGAGILRGVTFGCWGSTCI